MSFCAKHRDTAVTIHFETNMYANWVDDDMITIFLDTAGFKQAYDLVNVHYIHGLWTTEKEVYYEEKKKR